MEDVNNEILTMLDYMGCVTKPNDQALLKILAEKVKNEIISYTNTDDVPAGMHQEYILAVCGTFLQIKEGCGQLNLSELNFDGVKAISDGNTSVTFTEDETDKAKFDRLIRILLGWRANAQHYRKLVFT